MKELLLKIVYQLGFIRLWCFLHRKQIVILMLHGVADEGVEADWTPLRQRTSRKLFDETLTLAKKYFRFVSLDEAVEMIEGGRPLKSNSCVVTFDDGQLNHLTCALPILRKHQIPVVFYPSIRVVDQVQPYWFDRLDFAVQQAAVDGSPVEIDGETVVIDQSSRARNESSLRQIIKLLKISYASDEDFYRQVDTICQELERRSGVRLNDLAARDVWSSPLNWEEIRECANAKDVIIGSHTVSHFRLPLVDDSTIEEELRESKRALEKQTSVKCDHFCYPNGDWDERTLRLTQSVGYKSAVITEEGFNQLGDNPFKLKRFSFPVKGTPLKGLYAITGIFHLINSLRGR